MHYLRFYSVHSYWKRSTVEHSEMPNGKSLKNQYISTLFLLHTLYSYLIINFNNARMAINFDHNSRLELSFF